MKWWAIIYIVLFIFIGLGAALVGYSMGLDKSSEIIKRYEAYEIVNSYRKSQKIQPLAFNSSLCLYAEKRLNETNSSFTHKGFQNDIETGLPFKYRYAGENLADNMYSPQEALNEWIKSSSHKANILNKNYSDTCIVSNDNNYVQIFVGY